MGDLLGTIYPWGEGPAAEIPWRMPLSPEIRAHLEPFMVDRSFGRAVAEQAVLSAEYDWHRDPYTPIFDPQGAVVPTSQ